MIELLFSNILQIIGASFFIIFLFVLGRELVLWYFKININIENQRRTIFILEKLLNQRSKNDKALKVLMNNDQQQAQNSSPELKLKAIPGTRPVCSECGEMISSEYPIIVNVEGKTKYYCSEDCRLSSLEYLVNTDV